MLITAHGGALGTRRNSRSFLNKIALINVDVIEVDIRSCASNLFLSHLPTIAPFIKMRLKKVFEFAIEYDFRINCDVKRKGLVKAVTALAESIGADDRLIFTGSVCIEDIKHIKKGEVYLNKPFFGKRKPKPDDVKEMKKIIEELDNKSIKGINLRDKFITDEFLQECTKYSLDVSVFVVNDEKAMDKYLSHQRIVNITTNRPDLLLKKINRKVYKQEIIK